MTPSILVFDLDDTLYCERDFAFSGFAAVGDYLAHHHGVDGFAASCRTLFDRGERGTIFDTALRDCGVDFDEQLVDRLVAQYRGHSPSISLAPDAAHFLARDTRPRALITDGPEAVQRAKIEALGLPNEFGLILTTGSWPRGFAKPHPWAFEAVMRWSGLPGREHVYIADNPAKDFIAPRSLGWQTVQIDRQHRVHSGIAPDMQHAADKTVSTLEELASLPD